MILNNRAIRAWTFMLFAYRINSRALFYVLRAKHCWKLGCWKWWNIAVALALSRLKAKSEGFGRFMGVGRFSKRYFRLASLRFCERWFFFSTLKSLVSFWTRLLSFQLAPTFEGLIEQDKFCVLNERQRALGSKMKEGAPKWSSEQEQCRSEAIETPQGTSTSIFNWAD